MRFSIEQLHLRAGQQTLRRGSHGVLSYDVTGAKAGTRRKEGALSSVKSF